MATVELVKCNQQQHGCQWHGEIGQLELHTSKECLYQLQPCKYSNIGCSQTITRQELLAHENDDKHHFQLAMETILNLEEKLLRIQAGLPNVDDEDVTLYSFDMYNFNKYKTNDEVYFSKPYYTSPNGYKFCIKVYANGYKEGKGTHVSAFVVLMKGVNDDYLTWPFTGKISIGLFDQVGKNEEDWDWELDPFPANDEDVSGRVTEGEQQERGWGKSKFVAHADLSYQAETKCQFLKDDKIIFLVAVGDIPKPDEDKTAWLVTKMHN